MSLPAVALRRPVTVAMGCMAVLLWGSASLGDLTVELFPDVATPRLTLLTGTAAAALAPQEVERMVTVPLENQVQTVPGVTSVRSVSREGTSVITVELPWGTDLGLASLRLREAVDRVRPLLPEGVDRPAVLRWDPGAEPVMGVAVVGNASAGALRELVQTVLVPRLEQVEGIAGAQLTGGAQREIHVTLDPERLALYGLTVADVERALQAGNTALQSGTVLQGAIRYQVRALGEFRSVEEIASVPLTRDVRLRDVGTASEGERPRTSGALLDGQEAVGMLLYPESGANTVLAVAAAREALQELRDQYPGLALAVAFENAGFITAAIDSVVQNILAGSLLAFAVLFLFLRGARSPLLIGVAIPISITATFVACDLSGITLNLMTLGGLALGAGLLVDNSIVVLENIDRHRALGLPAREAARLGAEEVAMAVTASTLTTVAVFVPLATVNGVAGELFAAQAWTVSFALLSSLVVSLSVLPVLASRSLGAVGAAGRAVEPLLGAFRSRYERAAAAEHALLGVALRHRFLVLGATATLIAFGAWLAVRLPWELMPAVQAERFEVVVEAPPGAPYERLRELAREIDVAAREGTPTLRTFATVGADAGALASASGAMSLASTRARVTVVDTTAAVGARLDEATARIRAHAASLTDASVSVVPRANPAERLLGTGATGLTVLLQGPDLATLAGAAESVAAALRGVPGLADVTTATERGNPEIRLRVHREAAARHGVSVDAVARALQSALQGTIPTQFVQFDRRIDIRVLALRDRAGLDRLLDRPYRTAAGPVPFRELVQVEQSSGPLQIVRRDRTREVAVSAALDGVALSQAVERAEATLASMALPAGVRAVIGSERSEAARSFDSLRRALLLAVALVSMVMAAQFESLRQPFVVLLTLPLGWVGVVLALWLTGSSVNVMSLIGAVVLTGIVVNDGILEVDTFNRLRAEGRSTREAVLEGSRLRLRPVLMTTLTTVCALIPLALGLGAGAELQRPLAIAIIGGEALGTLLTLFVVPAAYLTLVGDAALCLRPCGNGRTISAGASWGASTPARARAGSDDMQRTQCKEVMAAPAITASQDASLAEIARLMLDREIGSVLLTDAQGKLAGILTDGDFAGRQVRIPFSAFRLPSVFGKWLGDESEVEAIYAAARSVRARDVMSSPVHCVAETAGIDEAIAQMLERDVKHLAVVRDGNPVGMLARHDLLKLMFAQLTA